MSRNIRVHPVLIPVMPSPPLGALPPAAHQPELSPSRNHVHTPTAGVTSQPPTQVAPPATPPANLALAGSLFLPEGANAQHRHPAVAILGGPGPSPLARSTPTGDRQWPLIWAHELAEAGLIAICYDQRGSGQSTGRYAAADRQTLYHDAEAVVELLAAQPEVDADALAAIAWDEGCGFALELAAAGQVQALVLMAPPFYTAQERFTRDIRRLAASRGLSERVVQLRLKLWQEQLARIAQQVENGEATTTVDVGDQKREINLARFLQNARFDPAAVLPQVNVPMLILHGEDDRAIPPDESAQMAQAKGEPSVQRRTYVEAGHFLYSDRRVRQDALAWLQETLGNRAKPSDSR